MSTLLCFLLGRILYFIHLCFYLFQDIAYLVLVAYLAALILILSLIQLWDVKWILTWPATNAQALATHGLILLIVDCNEQGYLTLCLIIIQIKI